LYVVLTMRSDFLGDCAQFQGLPEAVNDGQYLIPRMTRDERRSAVTGPAAVGGGEISPPLVNRLLNDVGDNPDQLPILQHALMRTWDYWSEHRRTGEAVGLEHYEAVGTMANALSLHADEAWGELPDERSRHVAEALFKALTERGADNREIRRPTRLKEICDIAGVTEEEVASVVEVFRREGRSFLMPPAGVALNAETVIDISHESLIRNWGRLKDWVKDEAEAARIYRRLAGSAADYREGAGGLLDDVTLQWVLKWRDKYRPNRAWGERYYPGYDAAIAYLEESREAGYARVAAERERDERELERARAFAEQQARAARRLRALTAALAVILLLALGTAAYALRARADAKRSEKSAQDSALAAERNAQAANIEREKALQFAAEAKQATDLAFAQRAAAKESEAAALSAKKQAAAEELRAEKEAKRAGEQATIARRNADEAHAAVEVADKQKQIALDNAQQVTAAVSRGKLIRTGLESLRRDDLGTALSAFTQLQTELKGLQPDTPGSRNFTPEQRKQFVNDYGWTLSHIGDTHYKLRKYEEAIDAYEQARVILEGLPKDKPVPILFETYHGLAHSYHDSAHNSLSDPAAARLSREERYKRAEEFYKSALKYEAEHMEPTPKAKAASYKNLAALYRDIGRYDEAEKTYKRVLEIAQQDGGEEETVAALKELTDFYRGENRYDDAARTCNQFIDIQEGSYNEDRWGEIADSYNTLGQIYSAQRLEQKSEDAFEAASRIVRIVVKIKQSGVMAVEFANINVADDLDKLGDAYIRLGRPAQAEQAYEIELSVAKAKMNVEYGERSYTKLANLYHNETKDYEKAEETYKLLIDIYRANPGSNPAGMGQALTRLGDLYANALNKPAEAEAQLKSALDVLDKSGKPGRDTYAALSALAGLYKHWKRGAELIEVDNRRLAVADALLASYAPDSAATQKDWDAGGYTVAFRLYVEAAAELADALLAEGRKDESAKMLLLLLNKPRLDVGQVVDDAVLDFYVKTLQSHPGLFAADNSHTPVTFDSPGPRAREVMNAIMTARARQTEIEQINRQQQLRQQTMRQETPPAATP
ncbi:MAG: hypothetical protein QOJ76_1396, partial [Acidobacteriota bacterium]|nr:hypothetical protein [Acidobacteriota bacterium]